MLWEAEEDLDRVYGGGAGIRKRARHAGLDGGRATVDSRLLRGVEAKTGPRKAGKAKGGGQLRSARESRRGLAEPSRVALVRSVMSLHRQHCLSLQAAQAAGHHSQEQAAARIGQASPATGIVSRPSHHDPSPITLALMRGSGQLSLVREERLDSVEGCPSSRTIHGFTCYSRPIYCGPFITDGPKLGRVCHPSARPPYYWFSGLACC